MLMKTIHLCIILCPTHNRIDRTWRQLTTFKNIDPHHGVIILSAHYKYNGDLPLRTRSCQDGRQGSASRSILATCALLLLFYTADTEILTPLHGKVSSLWPKIYKNFCAYSKDNQIKVGSTTTYLGKHNTYSQKITALMKQKNKNITTKMTFVSSGWNTTWNDEWNTWTNKIVSSPGATGFKKHEDIWYAHNAP